MDHLRLVAETGRAAAAAETLYARIRRAIQPVLPASADIRHLGATAIPGCLTKGDLDLVVRVDADDFPAAEERLAALFTRNAGSIRTADFAAFADDAQPLPIGIQLTAKGGPFDVFHHFATSCAGMRSCWRVTTPSRGALTDFRWMPIAPKRRASSSMF